MLCMLLAVGLPSAEDASYELSGKASASSMTSSSMSSASMRSLTTQKRSGETTKARLTLMRLVVFARDGVCREVLRNRKSAEG